MKKAILIIAAIGLSMHGIGQEKYLQTAKEAISKNNYDEAKENIDKAMASPEFKEKPKALLAKAQIYGMLQDVDKYKASNPYREAYQSTEKLIEVKPDFEKTTVDQLLEIFGLRYFNDGAKAYNDKKLSDATDFMKIVIKIHDMKRFDKLPEARQKRYDTVTANAKQTVANSVYYLGKYDEAVPLLTEVKNNPITRSPSVYQCLVDAENRLGKKDEAMTVIQEGRKIFPEDVTLRNYELNFYINSGKDDEMLKKLEEAASKDPNSADIEFNIATTYLRMAMGTDGKKPANSAELMGKSEDAFRKTLKISPDNAEYNYNFGALYFNQATDFNDQMNAVTGTTDADNKKYDNLKAQRDDYFTKAMPYFEKASAQYAQNEKDMRDNDRKTYKNTLRALMEIYSRLSKNDKAAEAKKKYESL